MGDMEVAIASGEDKIMKANKEMQVSVSFGKFENDSLSWEKFSSFSPNKYLEEVEKCATPGSVAQKKAYFESHYKKIAERNAEIILEQEKKQLERNQSFRQSLENSGNRNSVMIESSACYGSDGESTSEKDRIVNSIAAEENDTCNHEPLEETIKVEVVEDLSTLKMEKLEEIVCVEEMEDKEKPEEVVFIEEEVKEDISSKDTPLKETKKKGQHLTKNTDTNVRTNHTRTSPKPNQVTKKPVASRKTQLSKEKSMIKATTTTTIKQHHLHLSQKPQSIQPQECPNQHQQPLQCLLLAL
ncbi:BnaA07g28610D [Brassica napus]|uniref:BnaA07g28610D protein n=1 Tax=Brassica napus TaxID=3708 RepID=A0A078HN42_BRANA|nr:BnaA07g28610D [Brassica napus]